MVSQLWWTIGPRTVGIGHGGRFEPLDNSRMQAKLGLHKTRTAFPPSPKIPSLRHPDLVMLQPERVWRGDEKLLPDDDRGNAGLQFADHPLERDIAQIGRASCRERVLRVDLGGRRIIKKKNKKRKKQ